jgi:dTMP kinase
MATAGRFITFEGGEGSGKSTQVGLLAGALRGHGIEPLLTREPGGVPGAEEIRGLLVKGDVNRWTPMTEALLNYAARVEHLDKAVRPALADGRWVLCDRFADSTVAYQGYGHGLSLDAIATLHALTVGDFAPDLTLILDIPADQGLARANDGSGGEDRYERMDAAFHERLRQGFLEIAAGAPERCVVVDATQPLAAVAAAVRAAVRERLDVRLDP